MPETVSKPSRYGRRIRYLGVFVIVLIALYTGGWFYLAHLIETRTTAALAALGTQGVEVNCARPTARGYPFRIGLYCDQVAFTDAQSGVTASAGAFRSAGQIYDPMRLVAELDGPAKASGPQFGAFALNWDMLRASVRLASPLPSRVSFEGGALKATKGDGAPLFAANSFEGHMRPNERDVDLAVRFDGLAVDPTLVEGRALPALSGEGDISVKDGVRLMVEDVKDLRGQRATIRTLALSLGGTGAVSLAGTVAVDMDGLVDADLTLGLRDPDALSAALVTALPEARSQIQQGFAGLSLLGNQPSLPLRIVKGKASIGFIPLGKIPPLPQPPTQ